MQYMFEYSDTLNSPYEACLFDTTKYNFPVRPHWHYFMEFVYMLEGTGLIECNGTSYILHPGDLIVFHPEAIHAIYSATKEPLRYEVLKFDINKLYTENSYTPKLRIILRKASKDENAGIYFKKEELRGIPVKETFERCRQELEERDYGYDIILHDRICNLLVALIRIWRKNGFDTNIIKAEDTKADAFREITAYIDAHIGDALKVEELAAMCNMSYSYFAKNFKQFYGRSCKEYIEFVRVCKVEDLLLFTDYDLSYISQETGFSDSSHLIKTFRNWKGITPKQYRSSHTEQREQRTENKIEK